MDEITLQNAPMRDESCLASPCWSLSFLFPTALFASWTLSRLPFGRKFKLSVMTPGFLFMAYSVYKLWEHCEQRPVAASSTELQELQKTLQQVAKVAPYDTLDWKMLAGPLAGYFAQDLFKHSLIDFSAYQLMEAKGDPEYGKLALPSVLAGATIEGISELPIVSQLFPQKKTRKAVYRAVWLAKEIMVFAQKWRKWEKERFFAERNQRKSLPHLRGSLLEKWFGPSVALKIVVLGERIEESFEGMFQSGVKLAKGAELGMHARRIHEVLQMRSTKVAKAIDQEARQLFVYNASVVLARSKKYLEEAAALLDQGNRDSFPVISISKICEIVKKREK